MNSLGNGLYEVSIESMKPDRGHFVDYLLSSLGCHVSGVNIDNTGNKDYGIGTVMLIPEEVTDFDSLPEVFQQVLKAMNLGCWRIGYKIIHSPNEILCGYPDIPVCGLFVTEKTFTDKISARDLIHTGGEFVEWDTEDKGIYKEWLTQYAELEAE